MSKQAKFDSEEIESIRDLLKDFAVSDSVSPEDIYREAWKRYTTLVDRLPFLKGNLSVQFHDIPRLLHLFIYRNLFTFAGEYRKKSDPGGGNVGFGGVPSQKHKQAFPASNPDNIEEEVIEAFEFLTAGSDEDCIDRAIRFYQKFVRTHPFYDGNGRIARLITNMYLQSYDKQIAWGEFDSKSKFLKKLNQCHKNPTDENFGYLKRKLVVIEIGDVDEEGESG
ncbi:MAG: hypothetical protein HLUCCA01_12770 [Bacteroidetes bacterium HLUCCA01]|nr:MAG: hypothetical protein HLUCCA01_12770 [Bacteroidetes bacterium HLUCCA01]